MKVALVIGHKENSPGACNKNREHCEFNFNEKLAHDLKTNIADNYKVDIVYRKSYKNLPWEINELNPDLVVSLHCNAFNFHVSGTEVLYYRNSKKGKKIAQIFQDRIVGLLGLPNRGIKPKGTEDRGGYILKYTKAPCVLLEPFFIDNDDDYAVVMNKYYDFVITLMHAVDDALKFLST